MLRWVVGRFYGRRRPTGYYVSPTLAVRLLFLQCGRKMVTLVSPGCLLAQSAVACDTAVFPIVPVIAVYCFPSHKYNVLQRHSSSP